MNKKKISIIVPVYNGELFFEDSLNSLLNQTLKDIEIIIINDGSTDHTNEIIESYQERYPSIIKSKTVENGGAGTARNYALDLAEGEYVGFFDSDDFIAENMYEKLYEKAKEEDADVAICAYYIATNTSLRSYQNGVNEYYGKSVYDSPDVFVYGVPYLWNKIFRRSVIEENNFRFRKFRIFEDLEFTYRYYFKANKIVKVDEPLYYYMKLNSQSLTAKFTDKFFDIMPAMESLVDYCKSIGTYDAFEEYLLFIYLNHMYIRMNANVPIRTLKLKFKYINACFDHLEKMFPGWKNHDYYFENKERNKQRYISKNYWKVMSLTMKISKKFKRLKNKATKGFKVLVRNKPGNQYFKYSNRLKVDNRSILLDSQHGNDLNGNMFYLLRELQKKEYSEYTVYITVDKTRIEEFKGKINFYNFHNAHFVILDTKPYLKALATAKFLFNDTSFPTYFIKRNEQVYFNTWHGTPLKTLGKKTKEDFYNIGNLQKNFNAADYLLYPSNYMMDHMLKDYMLKNISTNKVALIGYPRNAIFFDNERRMMLRKQLGFDDKEIISYMPTWRGTLNNKNNNVYVDDLILKLTEISKRLKKNQILYLNVHPYLKDYININDFDNIHMFPKEYETYDFLNLSDILITDYSSVFFDFACTRRKIILYAYDKENYMKERGLYLNFDELPFPMVETVDDLMKAISDEQDVDYQEFIHTFAAFDSIDVNRKICEQVILNTSSELQLIDVPDNENKNVLCVVNDLSTYSLNERFFSLAEKADKTKFNYYVTYINANLYKHKKILLRLPKGFAYYGQLYRFVMASFMDRVLLWLAPRYKNAYTLFKKSYTRIFNAELMRLFNSINFDNYLVIGEKKNLRLLLFGHAKGKKTLYVPQEREFNVNVSQSIYKLYDEILIEDEALFREITQLYPECNVLHVPYMNSLDELI